MELNPLDNPVWHALNQGESHLNLGNSITGFFPAAISPFAGLPEWTEPMQKTLADQLPADRSFSVMVAQPVSFIDRWETRFSTTLHQMIVNKLIPVSSGHFDCRTLNASHIDEMLSLTAITRPGPFLERTYEFGNYYGVFEAEKLVAMAGERLHLTDYSEISAVCTHPEYTGRGYAAYLVSLIASQIIEKGKTPFLHVKQDNHPAISLYQRLGFVHRSDMYFAVFRHRQM